MQHQRHQLPNSSSPQYPSPRLLYPLVHLPQPLCPHPLKSLPSNQDVIQIKGLKDMLAITATPDKPQSILSSGAISVRILYLERIDHKMRAEIVDVIR